MAQAGWRASDDDVAALRAARCADPFALLGLHETDDGPVIRAFAPDAESARALTLEGALIAELTPRGGGVFEALAPQARRAPYRIEARNAAATWSFIDPYAFGPSLGPLDDHLLVEGAHLQLYDRLGAHLVTHEGVAGVRFAVWAPQATRVSVVGDFNHWDGRRCQMRKRIDSGVWEIFIPDVAAGLAYKFEIIGPDGALQPLKADPFGFAAEFRPSTASLVAAPPAHVWRDGDWIAARRRDPRRAPMSIYEVHLGSWRRGPGGRFLTWDELAAALVPYATDMGFTHLELLPVSEHPLDASWGYQPIGLFAPSARFGDPDGLRRFVDAAHAAGLAVLLDWVPAHFPTDPHGLARFDGAPLYEHADARRGFHPDWNTAIYDFGRREVANILSANALYWLDRFHVDGLRVDAVASMLYLDYSRKAGEWLPNAEGGNENWDAVGFLRRVNERVYEAFPGAVMIAEESTAWPGVSHPTHAGGLGFGFKWNMGWMNDTLRYMAQDPVHRRYHHDKLTFTLMYAFSENFILPLSHDEVVHGKGSILGRMPGDDWRRFANVRLYYAFMWAHPGKKLLFMGQEFAQGREWDADAGLDWAVLDHAPHRGVQALVRDLNRLHRDKPALHARDCEADGFRWIVVDDALQSVVAFLRLDGAGGPPVAAIFNFTPVVRENYRIGLPATGRWREILNTDAAHYGGSGRGNLGGVTARPERWRDFPACADLSLPPLAALYLEFDPE
ncbi:MAG: 1,4-alpha-glucan branching protein GlgB [Methylobacteriaceae bacterium]|nr:1,4-alpha-glucan branching protein GlgB [Methylobacteriaceae bacterium]